MKDLITDHKFVLGVVCGIVATLGAIAIAKLVFPLLILAVVAVGIYLVVKRGSGTKTSA